MGWNLGTIADAVFVVCELGEPVTTVPTEWRKALGFEEPVIVPESKKFEFDAYTTRVFFSFCIGVFIGLLCAYLW